MILMSLITTFHTVDCFVNELYTWLGRIENLDLRMIYYIGSLDANDSNEMIEQKVPH